MNFHLVNALQNSIQGTIKLNESMELHTTWKIGGPADVMVIPRDKEDIRRTVLLCHEYKVPWWVLGNGSNLLVLDGGIRGVVMKMEGALTNCIWQENGVEVEAGVKLPRLARDAVQRGLSGLEWSVGIPASVGGAVVMNAGVGNDSFGNYVQKIEVVDTTGQVKWRDKEELTFNYRFSSQQEKQEIITRVVLTLPRGNKEECEEKIKEHLRKRHSSQPLEYPTAGSVFKNPSGNYAGRLLEAVGAKGMTVGSAQVSEKHANFIINLGGACAQDVTQLINELKSRVRQEFQIDLEMEVHILGEAR
ncbi:MAG: UDP-N-acetylmuramate dehydrogenase [Bacillota bacterium]|nr:UDP-N-acetylmuramate dehydrogenase [Clostridia bacterium]